MWDQKILAIASAGGHWKQLMRLTPAFADYQVIYVSTLQQNLAPNNTFFLVPDANKQNLAPFIPLVCRLARILLVERPHRIVTTGAAPGLIALCLGRLLGIRGVWIDSFANVEQLSLSGRIARHFAQLYLTQWPHLAADDGPFYRGSVL